MLTNSKILRTLHDFGYFGNKPWKEVKDISGARLKRAIAEYQKFHGLNASGKVDARTERQLTNRFRCGLPDFELRAEAKACKWPMQRVTYYSNLDLPGISADQAKQAFDVACRQWMAICGIVLVRVPSANKANIVSTDGEGRADGLDGRGGTLAWSELPCGAGPNSQYQQKFDRAEAWNYLMAVAVICHELGHALGLSHLPKGNLMAPYYDPDTIQPQSGDIAEMVSRYGKPVATTNPPGAAVDVSGIVLINGNPFVFQTPPPATVRAVSGVVIDGSLTINNAPYALVPR